MKKLRLIFILLLVEMVLLLFFGLRSYQQAPCTTNWYWTTVTDPSAVYSCPNYNTDAPTSTASKANFYALKLLLFALPVTTVAGLVMSGRAKAEKSK